jgi:polyisoprenoid-binding protein YceI
MKVSLARGFSRGASFGYSRIFKVAVPSAAVMFAAVAWSQQHYRVDPATSEVHYTLRASYHAVIGTFHVTSGEFALDPGSGAMTGTVTVDAASGESGNKSRDKTMTNKQMKAQTYPTVTFAPAKFSGRVKDAGDSTGEVEGNFTLIGQAHPITVPVAVHMEGDHFTATGSFVVPFLSWGVKDPSFMFMKVDKEVKIELKLTGTVSK